MAISKTSNTYNRQNWEDSCIVGLKRLGHNGLTQKVKYIILGHEVDFPILCETCLGDNPYIRMIKEEYGKECKICSRPFTVFRWNPGAKMRFKKTEVCQTCSRLKNVCQTCLLDLEYGLPIQVRDAALRIKDDIPRSEINKEYYVQNIDREIDPTTPSGAVGKSRAASDLLMKLARTTPYYKRNRPHICSFWVKGECKRGEECPYRHEKPTDPDDPLADQNIKDRYYGVNDPVAEKLMRRAEQMPKLEPPEDKTVTTLYVGNLSDRITERDLQDHFYQYGEIRSITVLAKQQCAFVQFTTRAAAELAAERTVNKLILCGRRMTIRWGRSQGRQSTSADEHEVDLEPVPGLPGALPLPPEEVANNFVNAPQNIPFPSGMPPPFLLPPPMPRPLTAMRPPATPSYFFPSHLRPPLVPPPGVQPSHFPQRPPPMYPLGSVPVLSRVPADPGAPGTMPTTGIHYPSQDPSRLGTTKKSWPSED